MSTYGHAVQVIVSNAVNQPGKTFKMTKAYTIATTGMLHSINFVLHHMMLTQAANYSCL